MKKLLLWAGLLVGLCAMSAQAQPKLGLQTYTFRKNTLAETIDIANNLGIRYLQIYPGQVLGAGLEGKLSPQTDQKSRELIWQLAKDRGIEIVAMGVITPKTEDQWREVLAFAKERGIKEVVSEPKPADLPMIDKLCKEYGVRVVCHNHATGSAYSSPIEGLATVAPYEGEGQMIWLAPDTGHWVRAGYDPIAYLAAAKGKISSLHFKDLNAKAPGVLPPNSPKSAIPKLHDVPWGSGTSDAAGQIAQLRKQGFDGIVFIEYEKLDPDLYDNVAKSIDFFNRAVAADLKDLEAGKVAPATAVPADKVRKAGVVVNVK